MVSIKDKTFTILLLATVFTLFFVGTALADQGNSTTTAAPTTDPSLTPTPNATATPVPTPTARQVFSSPSWNVDHECIVVKNNGATITVVAWIEDPANNLKYEVDTGPAKTVFTPSALVQSGQIVNCGFQAYENNTLIESRNFTITIGPTPTALPPESVTISGTIVDADNGTPISGATVTFESITYGKTYSASPTGSDGTYLSPKMYPDFYRITMNAPGYKVARSTTNDKVAVDSTVDTIALARQAGVQTPTPTPLKPSPTPVNPVDPWISLLYNPALCVGTISSLIAVIAGSIGIYEWMERKREGRLRKEKEDASKGGEKKDDSGAGIKKP